MNKKPIAKRLNFTINFLNECISKNDRILDLGVDNSFAQSLRNHGYNISNTTGENLDDSFDSVKTDEYDVVTAFEIFEHLLAPYNILKEIKAKKLIITVPLKLWFTSAYWNDDDIYDCHYHEFEPKQLDLLLQRTGWKILKRKKWTAPGGFLGVRQILRFFYPRYYAVYCERK